MNLIKRRTRKCAAVLVAFLVYLEEMGNVNTFPTSIPLSSHSAIIDIGYTGIRYGRRDGHQQSGV